MHKGGMYMSENLYDKEIPEELLEGISDDERMTEEKDRPSI